MAKTLTEQLQKMSKTFGEKGMELVKEANRSNFNLTPFNEDVVRQVAPSYREGFSLLPVLFRILYVNEIFLDDRRDSGTMGDQQGGGGGHRGNFSKCLSKVPSLFSTDQIKWIG